MTGNENLLTSQAGVATRTAIVIVISTSAAAGERADRSGPILAEGLKELGFNVLDTMVVADEDFGALWASIHGREDLPDVVITSGGTGLSPDDTTVETIQPTLERELPGVSHQFFAVGMNSAPTAVLSRTIAGSIGTSFVIALPGSTGAARDGLTVLEPILHHALDQLADIRTH